MNDKQSKILRQLETLRFQYEELERDFDRAMHIDAYAFPQDHGLPSVKELGEQLATLKRRVDELNHEYEQVADCEEFCKRFGRDAHDAYKAKYPIGFKTKVVEMKNPYYTPVVYPLQPDPLSYSAFVADAEIPKAVPFVTKQALFEAWAFRQYSGRVLMEAPGLGYEYLAYAPEIDTVFVAKQR